MILAKQHNANRNHENAKEKKLENRNEGNKRLKLKTKSPLFKVISSVWLEAEIKKTTKAGGWI